MPRIPSWSRSQTHVFMFMLFTLLFPVLALGLGLLGPVVDDRRIGHVALTVVLLGALLSALTWIVFRHADRRLASRENRASQCPLK